MMNSLFYDKSSAAKLKALLTYLKSNNPYYRDILRNVDLNENIEKIYYLLPKIDKTVIKNNQEKFLSYTQEIVRSEYTSGSTGEPLNCLKTASERNILSINIWKKRWEYDPQVNPDTFMELFGKTNIKYNINFSDISETNIIKILDLFDKIKPRWLCASTSMLWNYARVINKQRRKIEYVKFIELQGEFVDEFDRNIIEEAFKAKTIIHYGLREVWTVAYECQYHNLHAWSDSFLFEIEEIEDTGVGNIIITSLNNYYMPLIRYSTGDIGKIDKMSKCKCGKSNELCLTLIGGRMASIIEGTGLIGEILFKRIIQKILRDYKYGENAIDAFTVIQLKTNEFTYYIKKGIAYSSDIESLIAKLTKEALGSNVIVNIDYNYNFLLSKNGKHAVFLKKSANFTDS